MPLHTPHDIAALVFDVMQALRAIAGLGRTIAQYDSDDFGAQVGAVASILADRLSEAYCALEDVGAVLQAMRDRTDPDPPDRRRRA